MRRLAMLLSVSVCFASSLAHANPCGVPPYMMPTDKTLPKVKAAVASAKNLTILVIGTLSSTLPGQRGPAMAYPARLEVALQQRLPGVVVKIAPDVRRRRIASDEVRELPKLLNDFKPSLVIWQTGTVDAIGGVAPSRFRNSLRNGIRIVQRAGADVVFVNMQYSPRTESMIPISTYADSMRWVAQQQGVPLFDRLAIMHHWHEAGRFDLAASTRNMRTAEMVHDCIGRLLAELVITDAGLDAQAERPQ